MSSPDITDRERAAVAGVPLSYPMCEDWGARAPAMPFSSVMTVEQVDIVCRALTRALGA
jgi:hypothetical protein